jgi:hypothetical protein
MLKKDATKIIDEQEVYFNNVKSPQFVEVES